MRTLVHNIDIRCQSLESDGLETNIQAWFEAQPSLGDKTWLLAYCDDGILWGEIQDGKLVTSADAFPHMFPPLRPAALQQARLFGSNGEIRVWRREERFCACLVEELASPQAEAFDEDYILWGTNAETQNHNLGFSLMVEGRQGFRHAVPLLVSTTPAGTRQTGRPLRLRVRHYIAYDENRGAHVRLSRLVKLSMV